MDYERLKKQLVVHEGLETKLYHCSMGHPTIGVGRNLSVGISESEAMYLLENDIANVEAQCRTTFDWFDNLSDKRQEAIVNLVFNMGLSTFCKFKKTIGYIEQGLFELAGTELLDSNYARQVGQRSKDVAIMLAEG